MGVTWDAGIAISGEGDVTPGAPFWRVELDTIPGYLSVTSDTPPRYRYLGRIGAIDGDYRTRGDAVVYAAQEGAAEIAINTGLYWVLVLGVSGTLYRGVGSMSDSNVGCRIANNAAQALTTSTNTTLTFQVEEQDPWGMHSPTTNPERITILVPGWYVVGAAVTFQDNVTGQRSLKLLRNGAERIATQAGMAVTDANIFSRLSVESAIYMNTGDYLTVDAFQASGGNLNVLGTGGNEAKMWAVKVA